MPDFLLELRSEEIPARMQAKASADLVRLFSERLNEAGLYSAGIEAYATPRRLALIARGLPDATQATSEELKGPRASAPPQALEGFLRKTGLTRDQLEERDGIFFAVTEKPGRPTAAVLAEAIPAIIRAFPWPKSMRWGAASLSTDSLRWVRPLQGIVALLGEDIVEFEIAGIRSGAATVGHRFHHPGPITIGSANDYVEKLRACHVILNPAERQRLIAEGAAALAREAGLTLVEDEGLLAENAGLTEWPVPLLGRFDLAYLQVPPEVIQLTMRTNQKYFALRDGQGQLAPNFICTANIEASDGGQAIVQGNQKVLAARLADAKFFWEQDLKIPLEQQAEKLGQIVFHEKLGTLADKVDRVAKLARWLVEEGIIKPSPLQGRGTSGAAGAGEGDSGGSPPLPTSLRSATLSPEGEREELAALAERAARLCKADLVTGMVGEFPELQGIIGGHLARAQGEHPAVAAAIRDHYKPVGQGDEVPTAPVTVAVSLADKLDSIVTFFALGEFPTGTRDPFALRRASIGLIQLLLTNRLRLPIQSYLKSLFQEFLFTDREGLHRVQIDFETSTFTEMDDPLSAFAPYDPTKPTYFFTARPSDDWFQFPDDPVQASVYCEFELIAEAQFLPQTHRFFADRLKVQQRGAGVRHDLIDAVFALGGEDDLVRLLARVRALQAFVETPEGADLLAGYKRAANILKKEGWQPTPLPDFREGSGVGASEASSSSALEEVPSPMAPAPTPSPSRKSGRGEKELSYTPLPEEAQLIAALDSAEPRARAAVAAEDFEGAMAALASLRAPVDAFFDKVTVNDPDPVKRDARLALLARMRDAVHAVADFSRIEG